LRSGFRLRAPASTRCRSSRSRPQSGSSWRSTAELLPLVRINNLPPRKPGCNAALRVIDRMLGQPVSVACGIDLLFCAAGNVPGHVARAPGHASGEPDQRSG